MINKDGGNNFWILWGGDTAVIRRDIELMGGPPLEKPCSEALFGLKSTEYADFQVKF